MLNITAHTNMNMNISPWCLHIWCWTSWINNQVWSKPDSRVCAGRTVSAYLACNVMVTWTTRSKWITAFATWSTIWSWTLMFAPISSNQSWWVVAGGCLWCTAIYCCHAWVNRPRGDWTHTCLFDNGSHIYHINSIFRYHKASNKELTIAHSHGKILWELLVRG